MRAVNLLPQSRRATARRAAKSQARATKMILLTTAGAVLAIAALSAVAVVQGRNAVSSRQATLNGLQQQVDTVKISTRAAEEKQAEVKVRYDAVALAASPQKRMRWDQLLDSISRALPKGAWLSSLKAQSPTPVVLDPTKLAATAPGATPTLPDAFVVSGYVVTPALLPYVVQRLQLLPMLSNVWLESSSRGPLGDKSVIQFTIGADLGGGS